MCEAIRPANAVEHVTGTLREFNVELDMQNSDPWWVQGDKACKIKVQLNSNELDILLATGRDWPVGNR